MLMASDDTPATIRRYRYTKNYSAMLYLKIILLKKLLTTKTCEFSL